jgi:hypothetical protein
MVAAVEELVELLLAEEEVAPPKREVAARNAAELEGGAPRVLLLPELDEDPEPVLPPLREATLTDVDPPELRPA